MHITCCMYIQLCIIDCVCECVNVCMCVMVCVALSVVRAELTRDKRRRGRRSIATLTQTIE